MKKTKLLSSILISATLICSLVWRTVNATPSNFARVSITSAGAQTSGDSSSVNISGDGRYVIFTSDATNVVTGDTNGVNDVFIRDTVNNTTTRVSVDGSGNQANNGSSGLGISYDGRYVVFGSSATNLIANDTNARTDIFVKDLQTGTVSIASASSTGTLSNGYSGDAAISADGRFVVFTSVATNLVVGVSSPNSVYHLYVKDMTTGSIKLLSANSSGTLSNASISAPKISCDGGVVVYQSTATNLVANDTNAKQDIFLQLLGGDTNEISDLTISANNDSRNANVSCNGNFITYNSLASNLVASDTNNFQDVFHYNRVSNVTNLISVSTSGTQGNAATYDTTPGISGNGRFVTFADYASNLDAADNNGSTTPDLFIRDTKNSTTQLVSLKSGGGSAGYCWNSDLSEDGSVVAFTSGSAYIVASDTNGATDTFTASTGF